MAAKHDRFTVKYCVDKPLGMFWSWTGGLTGYVDADMVKAHLPPPSEGNIVMVCGPPPMYKAICGPKKFEKGKPPKQGPIDGVPKALGYTEAVLNHVHARHECPALNARSRRRRPRASYRV